MRNDRKFRILGQVCHEIGLGPQLRELHLLGVSLRDWNRKASSFKGFFATLKKIDSFTTSFKPSLTSSLHPVGAVNSAKDYISSMTLLRTLAISHYRQEPYCESAYVNMSEMIGPDQHWTWLRNLSLNGLRAKYDELTSFLNRHSDTLVCLKLSSIILRRSDLNQPSPYTNMSAALLNFLNQEMSLSTFEIWGGLDTEDIKFFVSPDCRCYHDCDREKIVHYVTNQGPCPWSPREVTNEAWVEMWVEMWDDTCCCIEEMHV